MPTLLQTFAANAANVAFHQEANTDVDLWKLLKEIIMLLVVFPDTVCVCSRQETPFQAKCGIILSVMSLLGLLLTTLLLH